MCEVSELDWPKPISSTREVECFLPHVVQVLQNLEPERCELFGERVRVETGNEGLRHSSEPS
jgi:hypothetical protein